MLRPFSKWKINILCVTLDFVFIKRIITFEVWRGRLAVVFYRYDETKRKLNTGIGPPFSTTLTTLHIDIYPHFSSPFLIFCLFISPRLSLSISLSHFSVTRSLCLHPLLFSPLSFFPLSLPSPLLSSTLFRSQPLLQCLG